MLEGLSQAHRAIGRPPATAPAAPGKEKCGFEDDGRHLPELARRTETPDVSVTRSTDASVARSYQNLTAKAADRIDSSKKAEEDLQNILLVMREAYQRHLMMLKDLELERIDLQAHAQWLASVKRNWKQTHVAKGIAPNSTIEAKLIEEERALVSEIRATDENISVASQQVSRLRDARTEIEQNLAANRRHLQLHGELLAHCHHKLQRPSTTAPKRRSSVRLGKVYSRPPGAAYMSMLPLTAR